MRVKLMSVCTSRAAFWPLTVLSLVSVSRRPLPSLTRPLTTSSTRATPLSTPKAELSASCHGSTQCRQERAPFIWTILVFTLTFAGLVVVVFPYIILMSVTIYQAAAAPSALVFMTIFMGFLIPIMLAYKIFQHIVFRGKVTGSHYE
ncbi:cytochrome d ubiquinol oxidase subunit II [Gloeobacter morelensis]|uniref:cytochrome d ubiquinol oxidase subunit II n=1 Tax=Gloeobacter morelensis TaxID=2907343 RepID=UPI001E61104E|nr:cytochrome d ubiquinol oxidase subunit II [Gloeobacter morelensis]